MATAAAGEGVSYHIQVNEIMKSGVRRQQTLENRPQRHLNANDDIRTVVRQDIKCALAVKGAVRATTMNQQSSRTSIVYWRLTIPVCGCHQNGGKSHSGGAQRGSGSNWSASSLAAPAGLYRDQPMYPHPPVRLMSANSERICARSGERVSRWACRAYSAASSSLAGHSVRVHVFRTCKHC
ncbi:hypothetical protein FN846DRAFT_586915 [Sphaerosporella brunnea]|uniref:Uncharacterized protein n=1 Tax=Sphaerosporella brunnea TaxID=1250544 RepID=A0A5J5F1Q2_9PEZI|nr:hypothetical protein FN846DRAFT_586915 [Sphaerosporella brunnea]